MNKTLIALGVLALAGIAAYFYFSPAPEQLSVSDKTPYTDNGTGLAFEYPAGPSGYVLEEREPSQSEADLVKTIILTETAEHERMTQNPPQGGEGPAVIAVHVLKNGKKQFPLQWATENQQYSNYNLKTGAEEERIVGGANAVGYMTDGLYAAETVVVAHGEYMYVFTGQFMDADSELRRDFRPILESVNFIPPAASAGKININAVCEGALAYMTFPDGASAEAFVAECKEGKHPEVIEKYKADLNLDGAAI